MLSRFLHPCDLLTSDAKQIVYDATDGAIVIFGSPGSEIKNNRVISRTRMIMGGPFQSFESSAKAEP